MSRTIYKIAERKAWEDAVELGVFEGAPVDKADGYIHFSTAGQASETLEKHFAGQADLLLLAFDADAMGEELKWEPSRGGALFPHLYATLDPALATAEFELVQDEDGNPMMPTEKELNAQ
ncbi:DUF952 domain-containing protein [Ahrensia sp. R2A130]|uniref:DUF952 domain-containing protein n=1 Tax=Ahrensia sp. R2A130 TaxID=744979 RepID=UPI0001E0CA33|nr:DUF952 domain-containing protein [Ahrensia sp. R2A130]EFL87877.1 conserved hypothetical protein [Ahrensia sp. R2A130]